MTLVLLSVFWLLWFLNFSSRTALSPLLSVFERDLKISHALAGSIFSPLSLVLSGWLALKTGPKKYIMLGISLLAGAMFCLTFATTYIGLSSFALVMVLGAGANLPSAIPILTRMTHPEKWGKAIALHWAKVPFLGLKWAMIFR
jgi:MFS family permease